MQIKLIILLTMGIILGGYGTLCVILSLIFKLKKKSIKPLWIKYLAWFIIIPPILIPLILSPLVFKFVILIISLLLFREYANGVGLWKDRYYVMVSYLCIVSCYVPIVLGYFGFFQTMPVYLIIISLLLPIIRGEYEHMIQKSCLAMFGVTYFGWLFAHVAYFVNVRNGIALIFYIFLLVEMNDASGYIFGNLFGKRKLVPKISPQKTIVGFFGGILFVTGMSFALQFLTPEFSVFHRILFAGVISVGGTCGDLVVSFIKRDLKVKDFGHILPGHGGLLDRFDSIIFVAPLIFHLINLFYPLFN
jgi:phosphatidate cytidylyltransferase